MDAPAGCCMFCGEPADHQHHLTGRGTDRSYLHPELTVALCHHHHVLVHSDLRAQRVDTPPRTGLGPLGAVAFALRRLAVFLGRYGTYADNPLWRPLAAVLVLFATTITDHLTNLEPTT